MNLPAGTVTYFVGHYFRILFGVTGYSVGSSDPIFIEDPFFTDFQRPNAPRFLLGGLSDECCRYLAESCLRIFLSISIGKLENPPMINNGGGARSFFQFCTTIYPTSRHSHESPTLNADGAGISAFCACEISGTTRQTITASSRIIEFMVSSLWHPAVIQESYGP